MYQIAGIIFTILSGFILAWIVRKLARRYSLVSIPRIDRWSRKPTALMGGIAIYLSFIIGCLVFADRLSRVWSILLAGSILFAVGVIDDLAQLKPYKKLVAQLIAASIVIFAGIALPWTSSAPVNFFFTVFWLVGITNAINLLDNMDGLAGGISLIACIFLAVNFLINGQVAEAVFPLMLAGSIVGFLWFNLHPATIFMGDCGSMFLGFTLGSMAMLSDYSRTRNIWSVLLTPVLILMIPIFDTTIVTITRKFSGRPVSQGGRDHASHRLVALGMSQRRAVFTLYLFALISGGVALAMRGLGIEITILVVSAFALTVVILGLYLGKVRIYEDVNDSSGTLIRILTMYPYRRRVFEIVLDFFLIILAYYAAFLLRFEGHLPPDQRKILITTLPLVLAIEIFIFLAAGLYRGIWRYVSIDSLMTVTRSAVLGSFFSGFTVFAWYGFKGPSRASLVLNGLILFLLIGASRVSFRIIGSYIVNRRETKGDAQPVVIYGAGDGGELLIRELLKNDLYRYRPVAFIDDDPEKSGQQLHGVTIYDPSHMPKLIAEYDICDVLISSTKIEDGNLQHLRRTGLRFKRLRIQFEDLPEPVDQPEPLHAAAEPLRKLGVLGVEKSF